MIMIRRGILFFTFCFCIGYTNAQEQSLAEDTVLAKQDDPVEVSILSDTALVVNAVSISKDSIDAIRNSKKFAYAKNLDSLLKNWQKKSSNLKVNQNKSVSATDRFFNSYFLKILLWCIALLAVGYILYHLFLSKGVFSRKKSSQKVTPVETQETTLEKSDYDALIRQAYHLEDYRMATRYLFLKTLQQLSQRSFIHFAADKTNSSYMKEMPSDKRNDFAKLVLNYEYVWYGHLAIDKNTFDNIEKTFTQFNKS